MIKRNISYRKSDDCYYRINYDLKRLTTIQDNEVFYLNFSDHVKRVESYKSIKKEAWKQIENAFFLSKHFEWEYNGVKYKTTDKPIKWKECESFVFHNGKIWEATYSGNYYPRIQLKRNEYINPTRIVLVEKSKTRKSKIISDILLDVPKVYKWTDIKYCRNFEKIK